MRNCLLTVLLLFLFQIQSIASGSLPPMGITGPSTGTVGSTSMYLFDDGFVYCGMWSVTRGTIQSESSFGSSYEVTILWTATGTGTITFIDECEMGILASKNVTISGCSIPANPVISFTVSTNTCGNKTISYTATPPVGVTWYWQTSASGQSTSNPTQNYTATTSGTYYVRANCGTQWSTGVATTPAVTINSLPASPATPTVTTNTCGNKTLSKSGTPPGGVSWYWQGTNATGQDYTSPTATGATYSASVHGTNTYYIAARNNTSGCWSTATGVSVNVNNPPAPSNASFSYCEGASMYLTTVNVYGNLKWYNSSGVYIQTGTSYSPVNLDNGTYTYTVRNLSGSCEGTASATITLQVGNSSCDNYLNWTESIGYGINPDGTSKEIAASKNYADGFGSTIQSQAKSYTANQVLASQGIYDANGSQTLATLPAPINSNSFSYRQRFVTNSSGLRYSANDFDLPSNLNSPVPVGNNGVGTLGWYYSSANTLEPTTPITNYPYSRSWTENTPNPKKSISAGPGEAYKMGAGHEMVSERFTFVKSELNHYYSLQTHFNTLTPFEGPNLISNWDASNTTGFTAYQSAVATFETVSSQSYVKVYSITTNGTPGVFPIEGTKTVTPGSVYKFRVRGYRSTSSNAYLMVKNVSAGTNILWPGALLPMGSANEGVVEASFTVPAGCTAIQVGVLWNPPTTGATFYINAVSLTKLADDNTIIGYKFLSTDPDGKRYMSFVDANGRALASALVTSAGGPPYTYDYWSYTYYNDLGQVAGTVAPKGVNTSSSTDPNFATRYKYDHLGRLIETSSTDEGTTKYTYSNDGKIRFSQNQEQRNATQPRFSYTNYDYLGRLIESGEYTMSGSGYYVFESHEVISPAPNSVLGIIDNVGFTGLTRRKNNTTASRYSDTTFIDYDVPSLDFVVDADHTVQRNLFGQVTRTKNGNATTWYSYDAYGQLEWTKQSIGGLGYKTMDYTYDYLGNIVETVYQKGSTYDAFYHHYLYDDDQRLIEVQTSKNGIAKTLHARYKYYLHGPLKRIELAGNKQGLDYVYTISGGLKGINHADPALDPGLDGISGPNATFKKDVFGMNLQYYDNDYTSAAIPINTLTIDPPFPNQFGGNIKAATYHSPMDFNQKRAYGFQYDAVNQMNNAQWGSFTGSGGNYSASLTEAQREQIPGYDKNGNILSLTRKGKDAQITANYNYVYETNSNRLDKVNHNSLLLTDYTYNTIGQMVTQTEGGKTMSIKYNAYGLVKEIRDGSNNLMLEYRYDDRGDLVTKVYYTDGVAAKNIFYVNDAGGSLLSVYEQTLPGGSVQLAEVPIYGSGRVAVLKPGTYDSYFYEVGDHLGNVRAVIGVSETETYTATMESENILNEEPPFRNVANTAAVYGNANHTPSGNESARLNNLKPAGPAISFEVSPGDTVKMDVWAYYEAGSSDFSGVLQESSMLTAVAAAFGGVSGAPGEAGQIFNNVNSGFAGILGTTGNSSVPAAFLTYVVYDKNFVRKYWGSKAVTTNGNMLKEHLIQTPLVIDAPGYIYICLYNRSNNINPVYFDDMSVTVTHSPIVAGADYYPFGLVMDGREITDEFYRWGYQGQFSEKDTVTGWNEFELRMYDARFGRWLSIDPYGQFASPYLAMGNSPFLNGDPNGGWSPITAGIGLVVGAGIGYAISGDWEGALIGGLAGGVLGGAMFDQSRKLVTEQGYRFYTSGWDIELSNFGRWVIPGINEIKQAAYTMHSSVEEAEKYMYEESKKSGRGRVGHEFDDGTVAVFNTKGRLYNEKRLTKSRLEDDDMHTNTHPTNDDRLVPHRYKKSGFQDRIGKRWRSVHGYLISEPHPGSWNMHLGRKIKNGNQYKIGEKRIEKTPMRNHKRIESESKSWWHFWD